MWRLVMPPWVDARYLDRRFEQEGSSVRYRQFGRVVVAVRGIPLGLAALREGGTALRAPALPYSALIPRGFMRFMAPDDRQTYRPLLAGAFSPQVVKGRADEVDELIGRVVPRLGHGPPRPALHRLALHVMTRLLVGLPDGDPDEAGVLRALGALPAGRGPLIRRRRAERRLEAAVDVLRRRCAPGDVSFAGTLLAERPDALADETLARNLVYAVRTGGTDLGSFLHWLLWELAHAPDWLTRGGGEREAEAIVLETLRLHQTEYLYRRAQRQVHAAGLNMRRGTLLRVCVAESHRDAEWFPDPERWDPARFLAARPPRERYLPFGAPGTSCLGAGVAVAVARAFVAGLSRYRVGATEDGPPEHDGWHWHPSLRFRVSVEPA